MDRKRARNWYWWLWLSPLLTVPTMLLLYGIASAMMWGLVEARRYSGGVATGYSLVEKATSLTAVLISACWHLILLIPARDKEYPFVRWHGRQALLLAGVRTAVPAVLVVLTGVDGALVAIPVLIVLWLGGTLWGQRQALRGNCSLRRWFGREDASWTLREADLRAWPREQDAQELVEIVRFSRDPEERRNAVDELTRRGMVEAL